MVIVVSVTLTAKKVYLIKEVKCLKADHERLPMYGKATIEGKPGLFTPPEDLAVC